MRFKRLREGTDYQLVPSAEAENEQAWDVRVLTGDFIETVIRFGNIAVDGENGCLNFNFMVLSSPSGHDEDSIELQDHAAEILQSVLEDAIQEGSLVMGNPEENSED
jgi:hypothetical protein